MSNVNDDLLARGLDPTRIGALKKFRDSGVGIGGPIKRDRLWFFAAAREGVAQQYADGVYWNKLRQPASLLYEPDIERGIANTNDYSKDVSFRITWQATEKHKIVGSSSFQNNCNCVFNLLTTGARVTPEAAGPHKYYPNYLPSVAWTYPATSNILLEAGVSLQALDQNDTREEGWDDTWYRIQDQALNLTYGNVATRTIPRRQFQQRFAMSYLTGSHQFKTGVNVKLGRQGDIEKLRLRQDDSRHRGELPVQQRRAEPAHAARRAVELRGARQRRRALRAGPVDDESPDARTSAFATTRSAGPRPNRCWARATSFPSGASRALENVPHYRNLSPRLGFAYDLFGTGRTAVKASLGHYPEIVRVVTGNPSNNLIRTTNRTWNDAEPQLRARLRPAEPGRPTANAAPWSDLNFGQQTGGTRYADGALEGFNSQYHNWQGSVSLQHELTPGVGLNVGYYRTWYGGDCGGSGLTNTVTCTLVTDNLLVTPADYDQFCVTVPTDSRLPNSGQQLCGLYDLKPALFGRSDLLARPASDFGELTKVYNGIDVTLNARFGQGGSFSGGREHGRNRGGQLRRGRFAPGRARRILQGDAAMVRGHGHEVHGRVSAAVGHPDERDLSEQPGHSDHGAAGRARTRRSRRRSAATCRRARRTGACNANVTVDIIEPRSMFEARLQQVDLRISRVVPAGRLTPRCAATSTSTTCSTPATCST